MRFLALPQHELAKFCLKPVSETQSISSSCTLCCMLSILYASSTIKCIKSVLWPINRKFIYFSKWFHAVLYIALVNHVPLPRFPETFSMWYRILFGTKLHRFHYCCNLWWVQPLYCINTLDYLPGYIMVLRLRSDLRILFPLIITIMQICSLALNTYDERF